MTEWKTDVTSWLIIFWWHFMSLEDKLRSSHYSEGSYMISPHPLPFLWPQPCSSPPCPVWSTRCPFLEHSKHLQPWTWAPTSPSGRFSPWCLRFLLPQFFSCLCLWVLFVITLGNGASCLPTHLPYHALSHSSQRLALANIPHVAYSSFPLWNLSSKRSWALCCIHRV